MSDPKVYACFHCNGSGEIAYSEDDIGPCPECDGAGYWTDEDNELGRNDEDE